MPNLTVHESAEDYLETILILQSRNGLVRSIDIVNEMNFSKPSISIAMKKLREQGYVEMDQNGYISLKVFDTVDMGSHWMFLCDITESVVINNVETMTYSFYQKNVKPKPQEEVKGWVCEICGYVYEGDELPEDFICPLCKHPASDFRKMG